MSYNYNNRPSSSKTICVPSYRDKRNKTNAKDHTETCAEVRVFQDDNYFNISGDEMAFFSVLFSCILILSIICKKIRY